MPTMDPNPIVIAGRRTVLREWTDDDLAVMQELFDDPDVAYRTPLVSPFDHDAALRYLRNVQQARLDGKRIHLAITRDAQPFGEIMLNLTTGSVGYVVGAVGRGQGLATEALVAVTEYAHTTLGLAVVVLEIEADNLASVGVARRAGFELSGAAPETVTDKGRTYELVAWEHRLPAEG